MTTVSLELQPCCGQRSGIGIYTYELARRLRSNEHLQFRGRLFDFRRSNGYDKLFHPPIFPLEICPLMPYGVYRRIWDWLPIAYDHMFPHTDISHFFNYVVPPKISGTVLTTIHDMTYLRYPETMDQRNLSRIRKGICYSVERSSRIIAVSEFTKREITELLGVPAENICVIRNGTPTLAAPAEFSLLQTKFSISAPYLLFIGNVEPRKNLERLIMAFSALCASTRQLSHLKLVVAGGSGWNSTPIFELAQTVGNVVFTGYISEEDKSALYRHASLFAFPSIYEGFGIPILEAMSVGTPVLCSNTSSMPEVAGDAAVLVDPFSVDDIADGLYKLLTDEALRAEKIAAGFTQAAKFSWDDSAQKLMELYKSLS